MLYKNCENINRKINGILALIAGRLKFRNGEVCYSCTGNISEVQSTALALFHIVIGGILKEGVTSLQYIRSLVDMARVDVEKID